VVVLRDRLAIAGENSMDGGAVDFLVVMDKQAIMQDGDTNRLYVEESAHTTGPVIITAQELIETMQILLLRSDAAYVKRVRALRIRTFPAID
jgi:hypothetical protein